MQYGLHFTAMIISCFGSRCFLTFRNARQPSGWPRWDCPIRAMRDSRKFSDERRRPSRSTSVDSTRAAEWGENRRYSAGPYRYHDSQQLRAREFLWSDLFYFSTVASFWPNFNFALRCEWVVGDKLSLRPWMNDEWAQIAACPPKHSGRYAKE